MIIRPLRADEVDKLLVLWKAFMNDPSAIDGLIPADDENAGKMKEFVSRLVAEEPRQVLVAEDGGDLVGYLIFERQAKTTALRTTRKWGYISDLYVVPGLRGRGIGRDLLRKCLDELESLGVSHVRLNVWSENHRAMRLYREAGFRDYMVLMEATLSKAR